MKETACHFPIQGMKACNTCKPKPLSRGFFTLLVCAVLGLASPALCWANSNELQMQSGSGAYADGVHLAGSLNPDTSASSLDGGYSGAHGNSHATVTYGSLLMDAHSTSESNGTGGHYSSSGHYLDTITISDPTLNGSSGTAQFTYSFNGSFTDSNITAGGGSWDLNLDPNTDLTYDVIGGGTDISTLHTLTSNIPFTFGTPFQMQVSMTANAMTANSFSATMDITMSLQETGFTVLDSNTNPVSPSSYTTSSTSGTNYAQPAPEPATGAMLLGGLGVLVLRRRRARVQTA